MPAGCCTGGCCAAKFLAKDASGRLVYKLRASACGTEAGGCANFCAPSCCNESFDVDVYGPDGRYVNTSTFVWPGCNCGGLSDLSNFAVAFPAEANAEQRATLLGGLKGGVALGYTHGVVKAAGGGRATGGRQTGYIQGVDRLQAEGRKAFYPLRWDDAHRVHDQREPPHGQQQQPRRRQRRRAAREQRDGALMVSPQGEPPRCGKRHIHAPAATHLG